MDEEEAVFGLGRHYSKLRNDGDELPEEPVPVGGSMVLPVELADEFDKHHPPGPRRDRQDTDRVFQYELNTLGEYRMGAYCYGLSIRHGDREFDFLKEREIFRDHLPGKFEDCIRTNRSNRFDVITANDLTLVIDKLEETASIARAKFRFSSSLIVDETPVAGTEDVYLESAPCTPLASVQFPFVPFDAFWEHWEKYITFRKAQLAEAQGAFHRPADFVESAEVTVRRNPPTAQLRVGSLGTVVSRLPDDRLLVDFSRGREEPLEMRAADLIFIRHSDAG